MGFPRSDDDRRGAHTTLHRQVVLLSLIHILSCRKKNNVRVVCELPQQKRIMDKDKSKIGEFHFVTEPYLLDFRGRVTIPMIGNYLDVYKRQMLHKGMPVYPVK